MLADLIRVDSVRAGGDRFHRRRILDLVYFGDQKGQLWRIDLSDLRMGSAPSSGAGDTRSTFRRFREAVPRFPGAAAGRPAIDPFYPVYYRPAAVTSATTSTASRPSASPSEPATGTTSCRRLPREPELQAALLLRRRQGEHSTPTESTSGMLNIASPTAPVALFFFCRSKDGSCS